MKFSIFGRSNVLNLLAKARFSDPNYHHFWVSHQHFLCSRWRTILRHPPRSQWFGLRRRIRWVSERAVWKKMCFFAENAELSQNPSKSIKISTTSKFRTPHFFHEIISFWHHFPGKRAHISSYLNSWAPSRREGPWTLEKFHRATTSTGEFFDVPSCSKQPWK